MNPSQSDYVDYANLVASNAAMVAQFEKAMISLKSKKSFSLSQLKKEFESKPPGDETLLALVAVFEKLDAVEVSKDRIRVNTSRLPKTLQVLDGIKLGAAAVREETSGAVDLICAIPPTFEALSRKRIELETRNLRVSLLDLLASAKSSLLLASPFWDQEIADELAELIEKRLQAGISVQILCRAANPKSKDDQAVLSLFSRFSKYESFSLFTWFERDPSIPFGSSTFHFKVAIADKGSKAYLGTANFTTGSLRSRFELGVILSAPQAKSLHKVVSEVMSLAKKAV